MAAISSSKTQSTCPTQTVQLTVPGIEKHTRHNTLLIVSTSCCQRPCPPSQRLDNQILKLFNNARGYVYKSFLSTDVACLQHTRRDTTILDSHSRGSISRSERDRDKMGVERIDMSWSDKWVWWARQSWVERWVQFIESGSSSIYFKLLITGSSTHLYLLSCRARFLFSGYFKDSTLKKWQILKRCEACV